MSQPHSHVQIRLHPDGILHVPRRLELPPGNLRRVERSSNRAGLAGHKRSQAAEDRGAILRWSGVLIRSHALNPCAEAELVVGTGDLSVSRKGEQVPGVDGSLASAHGAGARKCAAAAEIAPDRDGPDRLTLDER